MMHKAITNCIFQCRLTESSSQGANHLKWVISHPWPCDRGHCEDWKGNVCPEQNPQKWQNTPGKQEQKMWPRMATSYPDLEQIPKMYLVGEDRRVWHAVFSVIELSISCLTWEMCLESSVKTCLISHLSWGREALSHRQFPGKRWTWKHRQGPQQPLQCQGTRVPVTFPSSGVPTPAKEL